MAKNIYHNIPGYSKYEITKDGILRNKKTAVVISRQEPNENMPYYYYSLTADKSNKITTVPLHKLLALAFIKLPEGYDYEDVIDSYKNRALVVDHIDRNKLNNSLDNLRWVSCLENSANVGDKKQGAPKGNKNGKGHGYNPDSKKRYRYFYKGKGPYKLREMAKLLNCSHAKITESFRQNIGLVKSGELTRREVPLKKDIITRPRTLGNNTRYSYIYGGVSYSLGEIADIFGVSKNLVCMWFNLDYGPAKDGIIIRVRN